MSQAKQVVTIGSALVDIFIASPNFRIDTTAETKLTCQATGGKLSVESFMLRTGGGGGNTAVGFSRLGFATSCITELGRDDWATVVLDDLRKEKVAIGQVISEKKEQTGGSVILVSPEGERMVLVYRGASSQLDPHDVPDSALQPADWLHVTNLSGMTQTIQQIFTQAERTGTAVSWNPGKSDLTGVVTGTITDFRAVKILLVNRDEWAVLASKQPNLLSEIDQIVVTDGMSGGTVYLHKEKISYQANKVESVDNTGAGDAFGVGFVAAQLFGHDLQTAISWGKAEAESVVQQFGAKPGLLYEIKS